MFGSFDFVVEKMLDVVPVPNVDGVLVGKTGGLDPKNDGFVAVAPKAGVATAAVTCGVELNTGVGFFVLSNTGIFVSGAPKIVGLLSALPNVDGLLSDNPNVTGLLSVVSKLGCLLSSVVNADIGLLLSLLNNDGAVDIFGKTGFVELLGNVSGFLFNELAPVSAVLFSPITNAEDIVLAGVEAGACTKVGNVFSATDFDSENMKED